jgi:hypothetical protein
MPPRLLNPFVLFYDDHDEWLASCEAFADSFPEDTDWLEEGVMGIRYPPRRASPQIRPDPPAPATPDSGPSTPAPTRSRRSPRRL